MNLNNLIFINNLPTLDIHGFDRQTASVAINDFVYDNFRMKNKLIVIIHGIGTGILKSTTKETLAKNKLVLDYKLYLFNNGCTVAELKFDK